MQGNVRPETMERITTPELAQAFIDEQIKELREQIGSKKVLLALSGGVDSSVVAALLIKAVGKQLVCVHVNHGLLRKGEPEQVIEGKMGLLPPCLVSGREKLTPNSCCGWKKEYMPRRSRKKQSRNWDVLFHKI